MIILWQGAPSSNHSPEVLHPTCREGFPGASAVKNLPAYAGDTIASGSISGSGRSPGGGNGNPLQYSCLENPMDRGAWRATGRRVLKDSDTALSTLALHREDTHPYLESRRGRSKCSDQNWRLWVDHPVPAAWAWVPGAGEKGQDSSPGGTYCKPCCNFSFIGSDRNFIKVSSTPIPVRRSSFLDS